jgi:hypothetical protein
VRRSFDAETIELNFLRWRFWQQEMKNEAMTAPMVGSGLWTCLWWGVAEHEYVQRVSIQNYNQGRKEMEMKINDSKIHSRRGENVKSQLVTRQLLSR